MTMARWPSGAPGRSRTVSSGGLVWTLVNTRDRVDGFAAGLQIELIAVAAQADGTAADASRRS